MPGVFNMWTISPDAPIMAGHRMFIPSTLTPFFYDLNILVESSTLLINNGTTRFPGKSARIHFATKGFVLRISKKILDKVTE